MNYKPAILKKLFLLFFVFSFSFYGYAQTSEIDSLKSELLKPSIADSTKIDLYLDLGERYYSYNLDSLKHYFIRGIKLSKLTKNHHLETGYNNLGVYYLDKGQIDSARFYFNKAIDLSRIKRDTVIEINALSNYAITLKNNSDLEEKVRLNLKVINLIKPNNYSSLGSSQFNLATVYKTAGYDSLAIKYLKLATNNAEKSNNELLLSYSLTNLIGYALDNNELDTAKSYLYKNIELCKKTKSPKICANYYLSEGNYYQTAKLFNQAIKAYNNCLVEAKKLNNINGVMLAYIALGECFFKAQSPKKAIQNFEKFEKLNKTNPTPFLQVLTYETWAKAEKMIGNYKNSNQYLEKYIKIKDSLNSDKNKKAIADAESKYESEKKDKTILENELKLEKSQAKTQLMSILIISLLIASILLWFLFQQRQKRIQQQLVTIQKEQEVLTLESLIAGEEKERLRIAQELHDGVNGDLSAIKFKLSSLLKMNNDVINEAVTMIDNSCKQVRAISHNLVPPSLKNFNLIEATESYCENMNTTHKPEIHFQYIGESINLNKKIEVNIFRIIQELVTNAIKHANAKSIDVQISNLNNTLSINVEDNGEGYKTKAEENNGIGMENIKSRVEYLNANLDVVTNENGTSNTIEIDLNKINDN